MNSTEILAMEAGEKLDRLIGEVLFSNEYPYRSLPVYSTDIAAAFQVVDKMLEDDLSLELIVGADGYTMARFFDASKAVKGEMLSESVCEAICKAALLSK